MATFVTYNATAAGREDLLDIITNIAPTETPMLSTFGKTKAKAVYHEWLTDTLGAAAANAQVEGSDATGGTMVARGRTGNYTQILRKTPLISDTQDIIDKAGLESEVAYQVTKALKELARDIEFAVVSTATGTAGGSGAARIMKGVLGWITTEVETGTGTGASGVLLEAHYLDALQGIWDNGGKPDTTYTNAFNKRKIDAFTANSTKYTDATTGKLSNYVSIYESSFGIQKIVLDRFMPTDTLACLQNDLWKVASLRPVNATPLAKTGSNQKIMIEAELTLESRQEAGSGKITGRSTS